MIKYIIEVTAMKEDKGRFDDMMDEVWNLSSGEKGLFDDLGNGLIERPEPLDIDDEPEEPDDTVSEGLDSGVAEAVEEDRESRFKKLVQLQTLGLSIVALLCGVFNFVEVLVNDRVSFPLLAVMFAIVGVWTTVACVIRKAQRKILLIVGLFWLALALTFVILWILSLCRVIK